MLSLISISLFLAHTITQISSPLSDKLWTEIKQSVVFMTNIRLFLSPLHSPPHPPSLPNTKKQSLHILGWREKTTRKMTSAPEKIAREMVWKRESEVGAEVATGESEQEGRRERDRGKERRKQVFWREKKVKWVRCSILRGEEKAKKSRWISEILTSLLSIIDKHLQLGTHGLARRMAGATCSFSAQQVNARRQRGVSQCSWAQEWAKTSQTWTPSAHAAQPHSLAKCWAQTLGAVAILLHPFNLRQPGVIGWTPNYDAAALLPSACLKFHSLDIWMSLLTSNMRFCKRPTSSSHFHSAWTRLVRRWKWHSKARVFLHRGSMLSLTGILCTQIRGERAPERARARTSFGAIDSAHCTQNRPAVIRSICVRVGVDVGTNTVSSQSKKKEKKK